MTTIDAKDREILSVLQEDGKCGLAELAEAVSLSTSPCWRRVKRLEEAGVISGYAALLDPAALDLRASAYVHVSLTDHTEGTIAAFNRFVDTEPQVTDCASITGQYDYLLKVVARDPAALEDFLMRRVLGLGIVQSSYTNFVLRQMKSSPALPL